MNGTAIDEVRPSQELEQGGSLPFSSLCLQALVDAIPSIVALLDDDGSIVLVNRAWHAYAKANGFSDSNHGVGSNYLGVCDRASHEPTALIVAQGLRLVLRGLRQSCQFEYSSPTPHGQRWFRVTVSRVPGGDRVRAMVSHEAHNEVVEARETLVFEELVEAMSAAFVGVAAHEIDAEIDKWLKKLALALGVDRYAIVERDDGQGFKVTHRWSRDGVLAIPADAGPTSLPWAISRIAAGETVVFSCIEDLPPEAAHDVEWMRRHGPKSSVAIPFKVEGSVIGAVTFGSVVKERSWSTRLLRRLNLIALILTRALERKRAGSELRALDLEIRRTSRVAMAGELTASLAHELNQPLGAILNNAEAARRLLKQKRPDLSEIGAALDDIIRDNTRAVDTIRQVRALFRRGEMKFSPVNVAQVLSEIDAILRTEAGARNISLRIESVAPSLAVLGHKTSLIQVLMNLLMNAFDAVADNGTGRRKVVVEVDGPSDGLVRITVSDSGKGVDPAAMPRLFDPFFSTKATGMGMGLAISRTIVENHGGRLVVRSSDCGASFEFTVPLSEQDQPCAQT